MHNGSNITISAAMLQQNKYINYCQINNIQRNPCNILLMPENNRYSPHLTYKSNLDFHYMNKRPTFSHKHTPPHTPNNVRYVSPSPISRMHNIQFNRESNPILTQKYSTSVIMPSVPLRRDYLNTPSVSFKSIRNVQPNIPPVTQSSPYGSLVAPKTPTSSESKPTFKHSNLTCAEGKIDTVFSSQKNNGFILDNSNKDLQKKDQKVVTLINEHLNSLPNNASNNLTDSIPYHKTLSHNEQNTSRTISKEYIDLKSSNDKPPGCPSETFSQVISNNGIIEIKKDLVKRVPDASNGVLQRLKPNEYIKMEDLVLEPATQRGTFGVVFKGRIKSGAWANKEVAVKRWKFDNESRITEEHFKSLEREIYAYRTLKHPNICSYIGVCLEPGFYAIITEYLSNGNLFELLYENKIIVSASDRLKISRQLCDAVYFIHRNNMVHRDIKTANIILDHQNNMKLCDFGQTRTMNIVTKTNSPGIILDENGGSPRYMAPECFYVGKSIDEKSDIWAIACCLLEIFGGPIPFFDYTSNDEVINAIITEKQKPKIPTWFHPKITNLLSRCFERKPCNRPSSYDMLNVLNGIQSEEIKRYGMNVKRNIEGDVVISGSNGRGDTKSSIQTGKRVVGNCVGVAHQRRIVVQAPTNYPEFRKL